MSGRLLKLVPPEKQPRTVADVDREDSSKVASLIAKGYGEADIIRVLKISKRRFQYLCRLLQRSAEDKSVVWGKFSAATRRNIRRLDSIAETAMADILEVSIVEEDGQTVTKKKIPHARDLRTALRCVMEIQKIEERVIGVGQSLGIYPDANEEKKKDQGDNFFLGLFVNEARSRLVEDHGDKIPELAIEAEYELSEPNPEAERTNPDQD